MLEDGGHSGHSPGCTGNRLYYLRIVGCLCSFQIAVVFQQEQAAAVIKERDRLGRELHDGQGQLVSYLTMQLEAARS
ncbi:MAG: histidine kinase, partial [Bacteroidota bacterium]